MTIGPGKYDAAATMVREQTGAEGVIVVVLSGQHGDGFSVQASADITYELPRLLRNLAHQIETDIKAGR